MRQKQFSSASEPPRTACVSPVVTRTSSSFGRQTRYWLPIPQKANPLWRVRQIRYPYPKPDSVPVFSASESNCLPQAARTYSSGSSRRPSHTPLFSSSTPSFARSRGVHMMPDAPQERPCGIFTHHVRGEKPSGFNKRGHM